MNDELNKQELSDKLLRLLNREKEVKHDKKVLTKEYTDQLKEIKEEIEDVTDKLNELKSF